MRGLNDSTVALAVEIAFVMLKKMDRRFLKLLKSKTA